MLESIKTGFGINRGLMEKILSVYSAYKVILLFLEKICLYKGKPAELCCLNSEMSLTRNNISSDPAAFSIWLRTVEKMAQDSDFFKKEKRKNLDYWSWRVNKNRNDKMEKILSVISAYEAMIIFINGFWHSWGKNDSVIGLLNELIYRKDDGLPADPILLDNWLEAVEKVVNEDYQFS